jgi:alkanesulfonate monooxygenase SsuD/methylene tetrahydromethanopterin reductase-like flavin-dependent oxidoreductase (luciferase family)
MRFGIFYEHQLPRPWKEGDELRLFQEALDQVQLADRLGIDYAWEVEHHFLEEYSHSSAPEVFLAACSQRTTQIRLGHGIVLMPPAYNPPARVAERISTLDLVSNGRVDFGTGESSSLAELGGFGVPVEEKREQWLEAIEQVANMMAMDPYPGYEGRFFSMPCRNVVPKPIQKPHPPLWVACSNRETIHLAARLGVGALTFAFVDPAEARKWVSEYREILETECVPIGHAVNGFGLGHHYIFGTHKPGRTDIWKDFEKARPLLPEAGANRGIGTPDQLREHLAAFEETGVDQVIFIQQGGRNRHEHICESLELFAEKVMPDFKARHETQERAKQEALGPAIERALARKEHLRPLPDDEIPEIHALGRQIVEQMPEDERDAAAGRGGLSVPLADPLAAERDGG